MSSDAMIANDALTTAVTETFGEMAFIDAVPTDTAPVTNRTQLFLIEIRGTSTETVILDLPAALKREIVENIHAQAWEELSSSVIDDCLLEFLNVLAGAYGRARWGEEARYKLSFPEVCVTVREADPGESYTVGYFETGDSVFAVHLLSRS